MNASIVAVTPSEQGAHREMNPSPLAELSELLEAPVGRRISIRPWFGDHLLQHVREYVPEMSKARLASEILPDACEVVEKAALRWSDLIRKVDLIVFNRTDPVHESADWELCES